MPEQARDLARLSAELGRQLGLVVSRKGQVAQVVAGGPDFLPDPDLRRLRRGRTRLAGYSLLRTALDGAGLSRPDMARLVSQRWDLVAALAVDEAGLAGALSVAHLLPRAQDGQEARRLEPFPPGHAPEDLARLVQSLEDELARAAGPSLVKGRETALLVSVGNLPRLEAEQRLDELAALARSAGLAVKGREIQRRARPDPRTLLGAGRLNQVLLRALRLGAGILIFDQDLSPSQAHFLARGITTEIKFVDRTQLILDIFAQRAMSKEGKLQVEMAQLRYLTPRLGARDDGLSRLTGGIGGRGPGETKLEIDRRRVRERLSRLERELKQVAKQRQRRRGWRKQAGLPVVSIVGYTNAGKSTLLNALTGSRVLSENRLFATLDPTTRRLRFPKEREVIITDTVGFIRDLPPDLRRAFAATLEELNQADLLLHVADAGNPQMERQVDEVEDILGELGLGKLPRLLVLNKMDLANQERLEYLGNLFQAPAISARDQASLGPLLKAMEARLFSLKPGAFSRTSP